MGGYAPTGGLPALCTCPHAHVHTSAPATAHMTRAWRAWRGVGEGRERCAAAARAGALPHKRRLVHAVPPLRVRTLPLLLLLPLLLPLQLALALALARARARARALGRMPPETGL